VPAPLTSASTTLAMLPIRILGSRVTVKYKMTAADVEARIAEA